MVKHRVYSKYAQETAFLIGQQIKLARKTRKWSSANLAERAGITRETLQRIENGDMKTAIGLVFEVATIVGVPLFTEDRQQLSNNLELIQSKIELLPQRIRTQRKVVDDNF
ncbi:MAG: helix-turn-helix transcriptional regulator [Arcobacteraceae bacterium]|jgi:transcriptional regulator with XRE-family HTH domain|nr:helix-turn-helix domain-containing protein [Campylobacterales bacterium]MDY0051010.1 helix-turn-helix transcriptional regulator [Aliarcobacter sp.]